MVTRPLLPCVARKTKSINGRREWNNVACRYIYQPLHKEEGVAGTVSTPLHVSKINMETYIFNNKEVSHISTVSSTWQYLDYIAHNRIKLQRKLEKWERFLLQFSIGDPFDCVKAFTRGTARLPNCCTQGHSRVWKNNYECWVARHMAIRAWKLPLATRWRAKFVHKSIGTRVGGRI